MEVSLKIITPEDWDGLNDRLRMMEQIIAHQSKEILELKQFRAKPIEEYITIKECVTYFGKSRTSIQNRLKYFTIRRQERGSENLVHVQDLKAAYSKKFPKKLEIAPSKDRRRAA